MKSIKFDNHIHAGVVRKNSCAEEFVLRAIELGLTEIGITDHAPLKDSPLKDKIPNGAAVEYCRKARALADKYSDKIKIRVGIEMDYIPRFEREIEQIISEGDFDFVIGSSHLHLAGMLDRPLSELTAAEYVDICYENSIRAVKSGYFNILAHFDMYRWIIATPERFKLRGNEYTVCKDKLRELFSEMVKHGTALEINTHLMGKSGDTSLIYPAAVIMETAKEFGLLYSYGSDAHTPDCVGDGRAEVEGSAVFSHCFDSFIKL